MSLITCCPACGTMFRVVPDQLKVSDGWVRCGHCGEVFDAAAHLTDEPLDGAEAKARAVPSAKAGLPPATAAKPHQAAAASLAAPPPDAEAGRSVPSATQEESPATDLVPGIEALEEESPLDRPFVFRRSELGEGEDIPSVSPPLAPTEAQAAAAPELGPDEEVHDLTFMRHAGRKAFWRRPLVRITLGLLAFALAGLLALQFAVHERDRLAVAEPALRIWLQRMCEGLDCEIRPPRQIEAIAIESSSFNKLRSDAYRLSLTLRNTAPIETAMPSLELTLTDTQDQAVVRRVLTPAELGATSPVIAAASEWSASIGIAVTTNGSTARIAGYRLLAFYP